MNIVWFVISILWGSRIILNVLSYIHLWYLKEYRLDRMTIHLKTPQGRRMFGIGWRRPPATPKTIVLFFGSLAGLVLVYMSIPSNPAARLLVTDLVTFPVVSLWVFLTNVPTAYYHWMIIRRAVNKLNAHRPMTVIGITGSYGKTSTKEILATILAYKYNVLKTAKSKNSPIGIAELVLRDLRPDTNVFIVEMGAYKRGEIAEMCRMVRPEIGIITAINAQHQDLFGSIQNTVEAKYELIQGLIGRRIAIVNRDNSWVYTMGKRARNQGCAVVWYSAKGIAVEQRDSGLRFNGVSVRLFGKHQVSNVIAAMKAAESAGMNREEIIKACRLIRPLPHTMSPVKGIHGSLFIDDTFNNNPDAAIAALEYLSTQPGRKIVVFQPMIELGAYARESHEIVAKKMGETASEIILTNDSFADVFGKRANVLSPRAAADHLKKIITSGDTVLFKGKEAGRVLQLLV